MRKSDFDPRDVIFLPLIVNYVMIFHLIWLKDCVRGGQKSDLRISKIFSHTQVCKHLAKLFDNMSTLEFTKEDEGNPTKQAIGMYSKEKEYVAFKEPFMCTGQVPPLFLNQNNI